MPFEFVPPALVTILIFVAVAFIILKLVKFFAVIIALAIIVFIAWRMDLFKAIGMGLLPSLLGA